jgi:hypothetical protein
MFRRQVRQGIEAVQRGEDPLGVVRGLGSISTYGNDRVIAVSEMSGDPDDPAARRAFARAVAEDYLARPPLREWARA